MQCPNCGANVVNSNFCTYCGFQFNNVNNVANNNFNSMPPVNNQNMYNQPKRTNPLPFILIGVVILVVVVLIIIFAVGKMTKFVGSWDCKGYSSSGPSGEYLVSMKIKADDKYTFGKYNDLDKNHFAGKYTSKYETDKKTKYNRDFYILTFDIDEYVENGINQNKTSKMEFEMEFINDDEMLMVNSYTLAMYYCYRR